MSFDKIVVIGGESNNPSQFRTSFPAFNFNQKHEISLTSICYAQIYNISDDNNTLKISSEIENIMEVQIKPGCYTSVWLLLSEIESKIKGFDNELSELVPAEKKTTLYSYKLLRGHYNNIISISSDFVISGDCLSLLGLSQIAANTLYEFGASKIPNIFPGFLYCNIVEDSWINNKLSRLMQVIPLECSQGWKYQDFHIQEKSVISFKEFSNILFEVRDMNGDFIKFDPNFKTIMSFKITPINS